MSKIRELILPLKKKYFDQIKAGEKTVEYRLVCDYWRRRLQGKVFDVVTVTCGYPSKFATDLRISFKWDGIKFETITHAEFGRNPVSVYAISLQGERL